MTALILAGALLAAPAPRLGVHVVVDRPTEGPVVALRADVRVTSEVVGDVVAVGGNVELAPGASVRGDVVAFGGRVAGPGAVSGRVASGGGLGPAGGGGLAGARGSVSGLGLGLLRAGVWLTLGSLMILALPGRVRGAGVQLAASPLRSAAVGALALLVWLALVVLALAVTDSPLGVAFVLLAVALLLAAKLAGVVAVAWVVGRAAAPRLPVPLRGEMARTGTALLALTLFALVPVVGPVVWLAANLIGIGAVAAAVLAHRTVAFPLLSFAAR